MWEAYICLRQGLLCQIVFLNIAQLFQKTINQPLFVLTRYFKYLQSGRRVPLVGNVAIWVFIKVGLVF